MKTRFSRRFVVWPIALLVALASGCATPALWKHTAAHEWKPDRPDQVILVTDTNQQREVVILFRQMASDGTTNKYRDAGWRIYQPASELTVTPKAIKELTNACSNLQCIPIFTSESMPEEVRLPESGYTVWNPTNGQLRVEIAGLPAGPYTLPTTRQERKTALRVCGLPVAIAADTAIVGAALFLIGASGGPH